MTFPFITDPFFYAVAIPAVFLVGLSKSGFGAGFGSLAVPLMALSITVPEAAAILMPVLLLSDLLGITAFRRDFDKQLFWFLVPFALIGTVVGALLFKMLDSRVVAGMVGALTLIFWRSACCSRPGMTARRRRNGRERFCRSCRVSPALLRIAKQPVCTRISSKFALWQAIQVAGHFSKSLLRLGNIVLFRVLSFFLSLFFKEFLSLLQACGYLVR